MTNNFEKVLFSTEEMMSNEIAQQIRACLVTVQHAQNRLQTSSDALISMMRQKAKIADSLELEEQTKRLISGEVTIAKDFTVRIQAYDVDRITNEETLHLNSTAFPVTHVSQDSLVPPGIVSSSPNQERQGAPREESLQNTAPDVTSNITATEKIIPTTQASQDSLFPAGTGSSSPD